MLVWGLCADDLLLCKHGCTLIKLLDDVACSVQKDKGVQRKKRQEEQLKADQLGIEGPKKQIPRVRLVLAS